MEIETTNKTLQTENWNWRLTKLKIKNLHLRNYKLITQNWNCRLKTTNWKLKIENYNQTLKKLKTKHLKLKELKSDNWKLENCKLKPKT